MINNEFISRKHIYIILTVLGMIGLLASFGLSVEEFWVLKDPSHIPACTINTVLQCSELFKRPEASLFGFPNMFIGLAAYAACFTYGVMYLFISEKSKVLLRIGMVLTSLALIFSYFLLFYVSIYKASVLCPYCLASAFASTNIFFIFLSENFQVKYLRYIVAIWNILVIAAIVLFYISVTIR